MEREAPPSVPPVIMTMSGCKRISASICTSGLRWSLIPIESTMRVYVVSASRRALSSETSESRPTITVLRAGPADSVDTNISTPDPSAWMGVMTRRSASSMVRPVMVCSDAIAFRAPSLTSLNGASAVEGAELDARNRYSPSTTSKSTARVFAPPISTARRESPCVREEGMDHLTKSEESPKEMQAFNQCSQRSRVDSGK